MKAAAIALFVSLACLNTGCISQITENNNAIMQSWVGQSEAKLIAEWGPPPAVRDDGQGGRVLVYGNFNGAYRMFYVNSGGTVYSWRWQGR
jgi:hypothetical protein